MSKNKNILIGTGWGLAAWTTATILWASTIVTGWTALVAWALFAWLSHYAFNPESFNSAGNVMGKIKAWMSEIKDVFTFSKMRKSASSKFLNKRYQSLSIRAQGLQQLSKYNAEFNEITWEVKNNLNQVIWDMNGKLSSGTSLEDVTKEYSWWAIKPNDNGLWEFYTKEDSKEVEKISPKNRWRETLKRPCIICSYDESTQQFFVERYMFQWAELESYLNEFTNKLQELKDSYRNVSNSLTIPFTTDKCKTTEEEINKAIDIAHSIKYLLRLWDKKNFAKEITKAFKDLWV